MSFILAIITAVPILMAMRHGLRWGRPNLLIISLGLLIYFVVAPLYTALPLAGIGNWSPAIVKAQVLALMWTVIIIIVSWWYTSASERRQYARLLQRADDDPYSAALVEPGVSRATAPPGAMLASSILLTGLAYLAMVLFAILGGGHAWLRMEASQFAGMGALGLLGSNILLFPLVVWYLHLSRHHVAFPLQIIAAIQLLFVAYSFLYSGVTGGPLAALLPFGILWCMRGFRISATRFVVMCGIGYAAVWVLRFMRLLGQLTSGGRFNVDMSSAVELFENSNLRPSSSFGEFFWFAKVVEHVDGGGMTMQAKSYLFTVLQFIPAALWPGKWTYLADARVDVFVRDIVLKKLYGGLIPVGMYGEAYLSYGLITFVIVAALIGWLTGFVDSRFRSSLWGIPGPLVCALVCPVLIGTCRGSSQYVLTAIAPILTFALFCRVLRPLGTRGAQPIDDDRIAQPIMTG